MVRVDPATGTQTTVAQGPNFAKPGGIDIDYKGKLYVTEAEALSGTGAVIKVSPATGTQTVISSGNLLSDPTGIAVVPPKCKKRFATVFGTSEDDNLKGTKFADVFWGGPGDDTIKGLKGDDLMCGNAGKDKLLGGGGDDDMFGGSGKDSVKGGKADNKEKP